MNGKDMRNILLSVRPRFANSLLNGTKTSELRKRFPLVHSGAIVFIYSSTPERAVLGTMRIAKIHRADPSQVWHDYGARIDAEEQFIESYLAGSKAAVVIDLDSAVRWDRPVTLGRLRDRMGLSPAQSYRYLTAGQGAMLSALAEDDDRRGRTD